jgi:hypothetical protein
MFLSELFKVWWRGVLDPLTDATDVLRKLADTNDNINAALRHVEEAVSLLAIGTEEVHILEEAGVGEFRTPREDA